MSRVLGVNAVFHDPAAAIVVDGEIVAAAEEERFSRRKHGKSPVPFSTWELPTAAMRYCLGRAGIAPEELDAVAYSYDPALRPPSGADLATDGWEDLRSIYAERFHRFLATALPGVRPDIVHHVPHHVADAASAWGPSPFDTAAVMVMDGRGECSSFLAGRAGRSCFTPLASQELPHSIGLLYEELTQHLGFRRSSDEYKVMALASYGEPVHLDTLRQLVRTDGRGGFVTEHVDWAQFAPKGSGEDGVTAAHADLARSVQARLEEVLIELATWLHDATAERNLVMAGGVALNCVANSKLLECGPFDDLWVQPAAGDAGTALGAAVHVASLMGDEPQPMRSAVLGPEWTDVEIEHTLRTAAVGFERPADLADAVADVLAADGVVAWFQGRSEFGPRALGHRSLLAHPGHEHNLQRLNDVKGREQFRPVAPMVQLDVASAIFESGPIPSPYMLFTHRVRGDWRGRIPAVVHVDGTARAQTVDAADEPLLHRMLGAFGARTGLPVVVNTSLNTAGRPMVDSPRDALECFGSAPIDALAIGPFLVRRSDVFDKAPGSSCDGDVSIPLRSDTSSSIAALRPQGASSTSWPRGWPVTETESLLQQAVAQLGEYFVGDRTLGETLHRVSELTIAALPQVDHVGITMMVDGRPGTAIFTHPEVPEIDRGQYDTGIGPCLDAFEHGRTYVIDSTLEPGEWQQFRDSAAQHGILSSISLPLRTQHGTIGAMNLYAEIERAFGEAESSVATAFAHQAAFVLANAQAYWDAHTLSENLERALASRATIEQAKGIIMGAQGLSADNAMAVLIRQSQHQNIKVRDLAEEIVRHARRHRP